jgi:hypothetical protein
VGDLLVPLVALGTTAALFVVIVGVFIIRRYLLGRGIGSFDCSLRWDGPDGEAGTWALGMARYEADRLDWFRVFSLTPRPARSLGRAQLEIRDYREPFGSELHSVLPGWVVVRCDHEGVVIELAMSEAAYNGFATWLESAPPGQNIAIP